MIVDHGVSCFGLCAGSVISTRGLLHIGGGGLVKGSTQGEHVRIDGRVDGNVHARDSLEVNGHVSGDILYRGTIRLGPDASLNGALKRVARMLTIEVAPASDSPRQEAAAAPAPTGAVVGAVDKTDSNVTELHRTAAF
ncbi:polymer-forming cytoskeletal protein [Caballeronia sp. DA-9]|uniref:polymer-forming cytoskeletal protein n=1 Tax=Caballeronia sp. DA-9 TaxID=3436237 RepID=UPI003F67B049